MANQTWKQIDAADLIVGRMCSQAAKLVLLGEHVVITNAKKAVVSGRRNWILAKYVHLRVEIRDKANPRKGPYHNSRPDTFIRQKVRFMLPKNQRGKDALKRLHVYITDIPKAKATSYTGVEPIAVRNASSERLKHKFITVEDICNNMGWTRKRGEASAN